MVLACIAVADPSVLELTVKLRDFGFDATAARIERGYESQALMVTLDTAERGEILEVLVQCPEGLRDLRTVLQMEANWHSRPASSGQPPE